MAPTTGYLLMQIISFFHLGSFHCFVGGFVSASAVVPSSLLPSLSTQAPQHGHCSSHTLHELTLSWEPPSLWKRGDLLLAADYWLLAAGYQSGTSLLPTTGRLPNPVTIYCNMDITTVPATGMADGYRGRCLDPPPWDNI